MEQLWTRFIADSGNYIERIAVVSTIVLALEIALPKSSYSWSSRFRSALIWAVYIGLTTGFFVFFWKVWAKAGVQPFFHINLSGFSKTEFHALNIAIGCATPIVGLQIGEFFYYWFHRLQHSVSFFWKFHAVHHSLREMSAWNSYHHFTEEIFRIPFVVIPMSFLVSVDAGYVPWIVGALLGAQGQYEHSCTKIHLGWFRYIVPDNRYHRIHHSMEKQHFDKNFGSGSALWDMVFRTAHFPKKDEWPDVGLEQIDEPKSVWEFLWRPFRQLGQGGAEQPSDTSAEPTS